MFLPDSTPGSEFSNPKRSKTRSARSRCCSLARSKCSSSSASSTTTRAARCIRASANFFCTSSSSSFIASSAATTPTTRPRSKRRFATKSLPEVVRTRVAREIRKLRRMAPTSPEYTVTRNFLDWIAALPWDERTDETLDLARAREILDEDHYGLEDVKDRILDFIAVLALVGRVEGPILCLVGAARGRQDVARPLDRARARPQVRAHVARWRARRS